MNRKLVSEFAKAATSYGAALYQHQQSLELVKRGKASLANARRWQKKPETRKVPHALEELRREMIETRERTKADIERSKSLARQVATLKHGLEMKTRQLVE